MTEASKVEGSWKGMRKGAGAVSCGFGRGGRDGDILPSHAGAGAGAWASYILLYLFHPFQGFQI